MKRWIVGFVVLALASGWAGIAHAGPIYGPGPHWVDGVTEAHEYTFDSFATIGIDTWQDGNLDGEADLAVVLSGPTTAWSGVVTDAIENDPELGNVGTIDGHNDVVETELVSLDLTGGGITVKAGDGIANGLKDSELNSPGAIQETADDPAVAYSFFDVFFTVEVPGLPLLHNQQPLKLEAYIEFLPPIGFDYVHSIPPGNPVPLWDPSESDVHAQLVDVTHTPIPEPISLFIWGLLAALGISIGWRRRRS